MAGPWEAYQGPAGPWQQYQTAAPPPPPAPANDYLAQAGQYALGAGRLAGTLAGGAAGALGNFAADPFGGIRRYVGNVIIGDPRIEQMEQAGRPQPGTAAVNAVYNATGFQPVTPSQEMTPGGALQRIGMQGAQGATTGAAFGVPGAVIGGASGLLGQAVKEVTGSDRAAEGVSIAPGLLAGVLRPAPRPETPSAFELNAAAGRGYDATRASGVAYEPAAVANWAQGVRNDLYNRGLGDRNAGETNGMLRDIMQTPNPGAGGRVTIDIGQMQALRSNLRQKSQEVDAQGRRTPDALAASHVLREIDPFIENPGAMGLASGTLADTAQIGQTLREANANYSASRRSDDLTGSLARGDRGILPRAEGRAAAANSGTNIDNAIRQQARAMLDRDPRLSAFTDAEIDALRSIRDGTAGRNALRTVGNLLGGGGGLGGMLTGAAGAGVGATFGPYAAAVGAAVPPLVGRGLKGLENRATRNAVLDLDEATRQRSPLYQQRQANMPPYVRQAEIARGLLASILGSP